MKRILPLLLLASCTGYEPEPADPFAMADDLGRREFSGKHVALALERLEGSKLMQGRDLEFSLADGLDCEEAFLVGLVWSPALAMQRQRVEEERGALLGVSGFGDISLSAMDNGGPARRRIESSLTVDLVAMIGGRRSAKIGRAGASVLAARAALFDAEWRLYSALRALYVDLFLTRSETSSLAAVLRDYRDRVGGTVPVLDRARRISEPERSLHVAFVEELEARIATLRGDERVLVHRVKETSGLTPDFEASIPSGQPVFENGREELKDDALKRRWDLQVLLAEYQVREEELRLAVAEQYPEVRLGPTFRFGPGPDVFGGALTVTLPDPSSAEAGIRTARARRARVRHEIEQRLLAIGHGIENAGVALEVATVNAARWKQAVLPEMERKVEAGIARFRKDPSALAPVVKAFRDRRKAVGTYWSLERKRLEAALALERAAGFPLTGGD